MLSRDELHIALSELEALDVPRAVTVAILLRCGQADELANLALDPLHYDCSEAYFAAAQATCLLKKSQFISVFPDEVLESKAKLQWFACEKSCFLTNRFVFKYLNGQPIEPWVASFISKARHKMKQLVGKAPDPFELQMSFGPGATMSDPSTQSTVPDKLSSQVTLTDDAIPFLGPFLRTAWGRDCNRRKLDGSIVRGNKFFTVPKDYSKRRTCAKEPSLNVAYQLSLGKALRKRLLKGHIDLQRGQTIHQTIARSASVSGEFATIDLSNASDCIAEGLVKALMPHDWYELLDRCRSKFTNVDGKWHRLEKFSSMGNGYTFELETSVFLVLILAIDERLTAGVNVWVYGDDIIVPTWACRAVLGALQMFGLTPNMNKTFITGPFRESCGGDYFLGRDVRPYYWKESPDEPARSISLANGLRRAYQKCEDQDRKDRLRRVWFRVLDSIPTHIRQCRGPEDLGDLCIHDELKHWDTREKDSIRYIRVWRPAKYRKVFLDRFHPDVAYAALLYGIFLSGNAKDDSTRYLVPRDGVLGYKLGWVPFS